MIKVRLERSEWEFDPSRMLGPEGGFGAVYSGRSSEGDPVAVKKLKIEAKDAAYRELKISDALKNQGLSYVIPILDAGLDAESDSYYLVMPIASESLQDRINTEKTR